MRNWTANTLSWEIVNVKDSGEECWSMLALESKCSQRILLAHCTKKRDILIISYLSSLEFECLLFEVTSYWLPWCRFSGLLLEQKSRKTEKKKISTNNNQMAMEPTERRYYVWNAVSFKFWKRSEDNWIMSFSEPSLWRKWEYLRD